MDHDRHLASARGAYLIRWRCLDEELLRRAGTDSELACFGCGEAAGLLRAYAPGVWSRVTRCTADAPEQSSFGGLPVVEYGADRRRGTMVLGVRPSAQRAVAERLVRDGWRVIRWDDLIQD